MSEESNRLWDEYMRLSDISDAAFCDHIDACSGAPLGTDRETWDIYKAAWDNTFAAWGAYFAAHHGEEPCEEQSQAAA